MASNRFQGRSWVQNVAQEHDVPRATQVLQLVDFFKEFRKQDDKHPKGHATLPYLDMLAEIHRRESKQLNVRMDDLFSHFDIDPATYAFNSPGTEKCRHLINTMLENTSSGVAMIYEAAEEVLKTLPPAPSGSAHALEREVEDRITKSGSLPPEFRAPYEVGIVPVESGDCLSVRDIRARLIGALIKVQGVIVKASVVRPRLRVAVYFCSECGGAELQTIGSSSFLPLSDCTSQTCKNSKRVHTLTLSYRDSKFLKWQELKLQELESQVPAGTVPRIFKVVATGNLTGTLRAGMSVTISGVPTIVAKPGFQALKSKVSETVIHCHHVEKHKEDYAGAAFSITPDQKKEVENLFKDSDKLYETLTNSIAPAIYGHEDVKKALLLQMVGGVTENFSDGLKIRGDIHVLLMGDPGVAKSQILTRICRIAPRAHFTTGKGTSGVGVTASVVKDPVTGEFLLEGGATVMADNGICCVDEFDKMEEADRTAIHEVMEQQTVSIAKAGLTATLSARTTILAAANPVFGRYDLTKSAVVNMGLPAALLSRFDLQFLLLDRGGQRSRDEEMALHLLRVHKEKRAQISSDSSPIYDNNTIRMIIGMAKSKKPMLPEKMVDEIVDYYVELRAADRQDRRGDKTYTTPRTLFSIIRMAQAKARLRLSDEISVEDFQEAIRLMKASKQNLDQAYDHRPGAALGQMRTNAIMNVLKKCSSAALRKARRGEDTGPWMYLVELQSQVDQLQIPASELLDAIQEAVNNGILRWRDVSQQQIAFVDDCREFS